MLDDRAAAQQELDGVHHFVWNNRLNRFGWRSYLGVEPGSDDVPAYAIPARRENLSRLPPAWIGIGDIDLVYDVVPGEPHGFEAWAPDTALARNHIARAQAWLRQALEGGTKLIRNAPCDPPLSWLLQDIHSKMKKSEVGGWTKAFS